MKKTVFKDKGAILKDTKNGWLIVHNQYKNNAGTIPRLIRE